MPDLGELRRGLRNRVRGGKDEPPAEEPAPSGVIEFDPEDEPADDAEVNEFADLLRDQLERQRPPAGPIEEPWSFGLGTVLAEYPKVPKRLRGAIQRLDRFGGLAITPEGIAFDGDEVRWADVTEIRLRHIADYLLGDAIQVQLAGIPLPPFPGRRRSLDALGKAMLTVVIAATGDGSAEHGLEFEIPAEVEYRGRFGRRKILNAGVLAAFLLIDPSVKRCVIASAEARGVVIKPGADDGYADAAKRAAAIRERAAAMKAELDRLRRLGRPKPAPPEA